MDRETAYALPFIEELNDELRRVLGAWNLTVVVVMSDVDRVMFIGDEAEQHIELDTDTLMSTLGALPSASGGPDLALQGSLWRALQQAQEHDHDG